MSTPLERLRQEAEKRRGGEPATDDAPLPIAGEIAATDVADPPDPLARLREAAKQRQPPEIQPDRGLAPPSSSPATPHRADPHEEEPFTLEDLGVPAPTPMAQDATAPPSREQMTREAEQGPAKTAVHEAADERMRKQQELDAYQASLTMGQRVLEAGKAAAQALGVATADVLAGLPALAQTVEDMTGGLTMDGMLRQQQASAGTDEATRARAVMDEFMREDWIAGADAMAQRHVRNAFGFNLPEEEAGPGFGMQPEGQTGGLGVEIDPADVMQDAVAEQEVRRRLAERGYSGVEDLKVLANPLQQTALYQASQAVRGWAERTFPTDPKLQEAFFESTFPRAVSQLGMFFGATIAGGPAGGAALGMTLGAGQTFEDALAHGADERTAQTAAALGAVVGTTEIFPVLRALDGAVLQNANATVRRKIVNAVLEGSVGALQEGLQEVMAETGYNKIAQMLYDEDRELADGLMQAGEVGGAAGFLARFLIAMLPGRHRPTIGRREGDADASALDDAYATLGVSPDATDVEIKSAYRRRAREVHPDVNDDPRAADVFDTLTKAYEAVQQSRGQARPTQEPREQPAPRQQPAEAPQRAEPEARETEVEPEEETVSSLRQKIADIIDPSQQVRRRRAEDRAAEAEERAENAYRDTMTGLPNQSAFAAAQERIDADPEKHWLSIDLTNFKAINDNKGRAAGDARLKEVAEVLQEEAADRGVSVRDVFRAGGDEFAIDHTDPAVLQEIYDAAAARIPDLEIGEFTSSLRGAVAPTWAEAADAADAQKATEEGPRARDMKAKPDEAGSEDAAAGPTAEEVTEPGEAPPVTPTEVEERPGPPSSGRKLGEQGEPPPAPPAKPPLPSPDAGPFAIVFPGDDVDPETMAEGPFETLEEAEKFMDAEVGSLTAYIASIPEERERREREGRAALPVGEEPEAGAPNLTRVKIDEEEFTPRDGWRENMAKAREFANALDIPHKGKRLGTLVEEIERARAREIAEDNGWRRSSIQDIQEKLDIGRSYAEELYNAVQKEHTEESGPSVSFEELVSAAQGDAERARRSLAEAENVGAEDTGEYALGRLDAMRDDVKREGKGPSYDRGYDDLKTALGELATPQEKRSGLIASVEERGFRSIKPDGRAAIDSGADNFSKGTGDGPIRIAVYGDRSMTVQMPDDSHHEITTLEELDALIAGEAPTADAAFDAAEAEDRQKVREAIAELARGHVHPDPDITYQAGEALASGDFDALIDDIATTRRHNLPQVLEAIASLDMTGKPLTPETLEAEMDVALRRGAMTVEEGGEEEPDKARLIPTRGEDGGVEMRVEPVEEGAPETAEADPMELAMEEAGYRPGTTMGDNFERGWREAQEGRESPSLYSQSYLAGFNAARGDTEVAGEETTDTAPVVQRTLEAGTTASPEVLDTLFENAKELVSGFELPTSPTAIIEWADDVLDTTYEEGGYSIDDVLDTFEGAVNWYVHHTLGAMARAGASVQSRLKTLREFEEKFFSKRMNTPAMKARQQFSTPLPIADAAAYAAGVRASDKALEPTAGTGNLINAIRGHAAVVDVNELEPRRVQVLRNLGLEPTSIDALRIPLTGKRYNVIITNPPYGSIKKGKYSGFGATPFPATDIAQRFFAAALKSAPEGGRVVAVMPVNTVRDSAAGFRQWLMENHTPVAYIMSPEGSYLSRGVRGGSVIMVVDKGKPRGEAPTGRKLAEWVDEPPTWDEWYEIIERTFGASGPGFRNTGLETAEDVEAIATPEPEEPAERKQAELIDRNAPEGEPSSEETTPAPAPAKDPVEDVATRIGDAIVTAIESRLPKEETSGTPRTGTEGTGQEAPTRAGGEPAGRAGGETAVRPSDEPGAPAGGRTEPGAVGDTDVVAGEASGDTGVADGGAANELVRRSARRRVEPRPTDSPARKREIEAANDSPVFAPYVPGVDVGADPHPRLVVETRSMAGMPAPPVEATVESPALQAAIERDGADGGVSAEQVDAILRAKTAWENGHGSLVADNVGLGKTRIAAGLALEAIEDNPNAKILYTSKGANNIEDVMKEFKLVATGSEEGEFPAAFVDVGDYKEVKAGEADLPVPDGPVVYFSTSYNFAHYSDALGDVGITHWLGDEAHEWKNVAGSNRGIAWAKLHERLLGTARFTYFTATPAVQLNELGYLYGLNLWPVGGFTDWVDRKVGRASAEDTEEERQAVQDAAAAAVADEREVGDRSGVAADTDAASTSGRRRFMSARNDAFAVTVTPAATEQVMREMKGTGHYIARDLWRGGVEFTVQEIDLLGTPEFTERYNTAAELVREITTAARKFGRMNKRDRHGGLERSQIQAYMKQLLFDMRLDTVLDAAEEAMKAGQQPVITVHSVAGDEKDGDVQMLNTRLSSAINAINVEEVEKEGSGESTEFISLGEIPEALEKRAELLDKLADLPPLRDPIAVIEERFGKKKVAAITGRVPPKKRTKLMAEFQAGKRPVAIISRAGKVGISLHDVNGKRRRMLVADYEWSADTFWQELGRVDRAGQKSTPIVELYASNVAGERKFAATIASRMAGIGAASRGSAESSTTGDVLDQFDMAGDIPLNAMRNAVERMDPDDKAYFTGSQFVRWTKHYDGSEEMQPLKRPNDGATMRHFLLELMMFPVDAQERVMELFLEEREKLMTGEATEKLAARRTGRGSGEILRTTPLSDTDPIVMYEVRNDAGETRGIIQGYVTPHISDIQRIRGTDSAGRHKPQRYIQFTTEEGQLIAGLEVAPGEARRIIAFYGKATRTEITPEDALEDLRAGDKVPVQGPEGDEWILHPRRDGRIQIMGATQTKHTDVLRPLGVVGYEYKGNFLYLRPELESLETFLKRFPPVIETVEKKDDAAEVREQPAAYGGENALPFYSRLERAITAAPQDKGTAEQWKGWLRQGVSGAEREWTGVDAFLDAAEAAEATVTREEVMDVWREGQIRLDERRYGSSEAETALEVVQLEDEAAAPIREAWEAEGEDDLRVGRVWQAEKHGFQWRIHEVLVPKDWDAEPVEYDSDMRPTRWRVTPGEDAEPQLVWAGTKASALAGATGLAVDPFEVVDPDGNTWGYPTFEAAEAGLQEDARNAWGVTDGARFGSWTLATEEEGTDYREIVLTLADDPQGPSFAVDEHWPNVANPVGHLRVMDRTLEGGETALHVEEVQSDWAEQARERGVMDPSLREEAEALLAEIEADYVLPEGGIDQEARKADPRWERYYDLLEEERKNVRRTAPGPFLRTDDWVGLLARRTLLEAARGGYGRVLLTPGDVQADRYNLRKHVDAVTYTTVTTADGGPTGELQITAHQGFQKVFSKTVTPEELPGIVGKDVAKRILNDDGTPLRPSDRGTIDVGGHEIRVGAFELTGLQLETGGEGMMAFYGPSESNRTPIVWKVFEKEAKKLGAKLEWETTPLLQQSGFESWWEGPTLTDAHLRRVKRQLESVPGHGKVIFDRPNERESTGLPSQRLYPIAARDTISEFIDPLLSMKSAERRGRWMAETNRGTNWSRSVAEYVLGGHVESQLTFAPVEIPSFKMTPELVAAIRKADEGEGLRILEPHPEYGQKPSEARKAMHGHLARTHGSVAEAKDASKRLAKDAGDLMKVSVPGLPTTAQRKELVAKGRMAAYAWVQPNGESVALGTDVATAGNLDRAKLYRLFRTFRNPSQEYLHVGVLGPTDEAAMEVVHHRFSTSGAVDSSMYSMGDVVEAAALAKRIGGTVVLVHNHPSGDPTPSPEDRHVTRLAVEAIRSVGAEFGGHMVINGEDAVIIHEDGSLEPVHVPRDDPDALDWTDAYGPRIRGPEDIFSAIQSLPHDDTRVDVLLLTTQNQIAAYEARPFSDLFRVAEWLPELMRDTGARAVIFGVGSEDSIDKAASTVEGISGLNVVDIVSGVDRVSGFEQSTFARGAIESTVGPGPTMGGPTDPSGLGVREERPSYGAATEIGTRPGKVRQAARTLPGALELARHGYEFLADDLTNVVRKQGGGGVAFAARAERATRETKKIMGRLAARTKRTLAAVSWGAGAQRAAWYLQTIERDGASGFARWQKVLEGEIPASKLPARVRRWAEGQWRLQARMGKMAEEIGLLQARYVDGEVVMRPFTSTPGGRVALRMSTPYLVDLHMNPRGEAWELYVTEVARLNGWEQEEAEGVIREFAEKKFTRTHAEIPRVIPIHPTHLYVGKRVIPLLETHPYSYTAASIRSFAHRLGFISEFGQSLDPKVDRMEELRDEAVQAGVKARTADNLLKALSGIPLEGPLPAVDVGSASYEFLAQIQRIASMIRSAMLTRAMVPNLPEPLGNIQAFAGTKRFLGAMADLTPGRYAETAFRLERMGITSADVASLTYDRDRFLGSVSRIWGQAVLRLFGTKPSWEFGEKFASAAGLRLAEDLMMGKGNAFTRQMDWFTLRALGYTKAEADRLVHELPATVETDAKVEHQPAELKEQYIEVAQRFATRAINSTITLPAEESRAGNSRYWKSWIWFDTYFQMNSRTTNRAMKNLWEALQSKSPLKMGAALYQFSKLMAGKTAAGSIAYLLLMYLLGGAYGISAAVREWEEDPEKFLFDAWLYVQFGPIVMSLARVFESRKVEDWRLVSAPVSIIEEIATMAMGAGAYSNLSPLEKAQRITGRYFTIGRSRPFKEAVAAFGIGEEPNTELDSAVREYWKWRRRNDLAPGSFRAGDTPQEHQEFRKHVQNAVEVMKAEDAAERQAEIREHLNAAIGIEGKDQSSVAASLRSRRLLSRLPEEERVKLREYMGEETYSVLEAYDALLDAWASTGRRTRRSTRTGRSIRQ